MVTFLHNHKIFCTYHYKTHFKICNISCIRRRSRFQSGDYS